MVLLVPQQTEVFLACLIDGSHYNKPSKIWNLDENHYNTTSKIMNLDESHYNMPSKIRKSAFLAWIIYSAGSPM
jgi:hypothetical protein